MPCAIFCFDVTKENRQELRQRGLLAKTVRISSCRTIAKFDTLIRDYCFYAYLCKQVPI